MENGLEAGWMLKKISQDMEKKSAPCMPRA